MTSDLYPRHHRTEVNVSVDASKLFACLDDHRRLAGHMEKPSLMMAGATMQVGMDALKGQAVGSVIRITGRVLGLNRYPAYFVLYLIARSVGGCMVSLLKLNFKRARYYWIAASQRFLGWTD